MNGDVKNGLTSFLWLKKIKNIVLSFFTLKPPSLVLWEGAGGAFRGGGHASLSVFFVIDPMQHSSRSPKAECEFVSPPPP